MRKLISLLMMSLVVLTSQACMKKKAVSASLDETKVLTCFVMDSTNALIPNAQVMLGSKSDTLLTGWDGRFQLRMDGGSQKVTIKAEGYKDLTTTIAPNPQGGALLLVLKSDGKTVHGNEHIRIRGVGSARAPKAVAEEDVFYAIETLSVVEDAKMATTGAAVKNVMESAEADEVLYEVVDVVGYGSHVQPQAGKLTAGEVNDFAKWQLWQSVIDGSHKEYVSDWKLRPTARYVVQVTNKEGFPMVDRQVQLVDANGTVFQARTDNTGKAELWANLLVDDQQQTTSGTLKVVVENVSKKAKPVAEGINLIELDEACAVPAVADVMFVMDATGSMGDELRYMTAELQDVIARSQTAVEGLKIRTGALVYRDHGDEYLTRISRLSDDISETQSFLDKQRAMGGGDYEEAIPEALMATLNAAGWSDEARARIVFLIFDAPCHTDKKTIALLHEQVQNAAAQGVRLVPVVCSGLRESGELLARSLALTTNGTSFFLTDDSGIGDTHLKPTTDSLKVEHLNDMLVRTIIEFSRMPECDVKAWQMQALEDDPIEAFLPNPTDDPSDHSATSVIASLMPNPCSGEFTLEINADVEALFLVDMTGKTLASLGAHSAGRVPVSVTGLATGVYFVKAFAGNRWFTEKVIVRQ